MRRTLLALAAAAALTSLAPAPANASHTCSEGFEILCTPVCIEKLFICLHH